MEELRFPINETSMHHFYSETGTNNWDIFVEEEGLPALRFSAGTILQIRLDGSDYLVTELDELPPDLFKVVLTAEEMTLSFSASVHNRMGFGIEDFRDCARSHYWDFEAASDFSLFIHLIPHDIPQLMMACPAELAPMAYATSTTCETTS